MRTVTRNALSLVLLAALLLALPGHSFGEVKHHVGVGAQYWTTVDDIDVDEIDEDGFSWLVSYQLEAAALLRFEIDVELLPEDFRGAPDTVLAPQGYIVIGSGIYAAAGIGVYYTDGDFADEPFYALRAGLNVELLPGINVDINANYRFEDWDEFDTGNIDTDTILAGAYVRIAL